MYTVIFVWFYTLKKWCELQSTMLPKSMNLCILQGMQYSFYDGQYCCILYCTYCLAVCRHLVLPHRSFKVQPLAPHMKPVGNKSLVTSEARSTGPFIFSSLRRNAKETKQAKCKNNQAILGKNCSLDYHSDSKQVCQCNAKLWEISR